VFIHCGFVAVIGGGCGPGSPDSSHLNKYGAYRDVHFRICRFLRCCGIVNFLNTCWIV
jgi:hypothetical protein